MNSIVFVSQRNVGLFSVYQHLEKKNKPKQTNKKVSFWPTTRFLISIHVTYGKKGRFFEIYKRG